MAKKIRDEHGNTYVMKKPFYKKWWFILLVIIVIVGALTGKGSDDSASQSDKTTSQTQSEKTTTSSKTEEQLTYGIGDLLTVGDVEYTVNAKSTATTIGDVLSKTANGTYFILDVTVTNKGKKAITVTDSFFTLLKGDVEYSADSSAGIYTNEEGKFFLSELNPGNTISGRVVFDLAQTVIDEGGLQLQVQTGAWGTETGLIYLD